MINALIILYLALVFGLCVGWLIVHIQREGMCFGTIVIAACMLFYQFIPLIFYAFPAHRDVKHLYNIVLNDLSADELVSAMAHASALVVLLICVYSVRLRNKRIRLMFVPPKRALSRARYDVSLRAKARRLVWVADIFLAMGTVAIGLCIAGAGGVRAYLSMGALARGIGKDVTTMLDRRYLPMITLSAVILIPSYLYRYGMRFGLPVKARFAGSFALALLYLVYNQGRVPLIMFLIPFLMDIEWVRRMKTPALAALFVLSCFLLERLSSLFNYLSYGRWYDSFDDSIVSAFLREFTYPFGNFALRRRLIADMGLRWGSDFVTWPAMVLPASVDRLFGVDKSQMVTISEVLTETYSQISGMQTAGGIPTDLIFFFYAQCGGFSLFAGVLLTGWFLSVCDRRFSALRNNRAAELLILRAAMVGVSCVNHFDVAVLVRTRFDLIVMLVVLWWLTRKKKSGRMARV